MTVSANRGIGAKSLASVIALAALLAWSPSADAAFPGSNGKIAFVRDGDIDTINPDGSGLSTLVPHQSLGPCGLASDPRWSPDGQKLAFQCYITSWTVNADGTGLAQIGTSQARQPDWSPDGHRIVFRRYTGSCNALYTANADGSDEAEIVPFDQPFCRKDAPVWSPAGDLIAFHSGSLYTVKPDGSDLSATIAAGEEADWSPAGHRLLYDHQGDVYTISPDGTNAVRLISSPDFAETNAAWSPDGTQVVFLRGRLDVTPSDGSLFTADDAGGNVVQILQGTFHDPTWQPVPPLPPPDPGYPRPRGATPFTVFLVPAYDPCTSPNTSHGPPLAFGSCAPPGQVSDALTIGTPDANGAGAKSIGRIDFRAIVGTPATPADEADVSVKATIDDVRCRLDLSLCEGGDLSDYLGSLQLAPTVRITDRFNGGAAREAATMTDLIRLAVPIQCTPTPSTTVGSTCSQNTTLDALAPGTVREGKRSIWELDQVSLQDGGIDDPRVDAFTTVAVQGLFVP